MSDDKPYTPGSCPKCKRELNKPSLVFGEGGPRPGDLAVCFGCGAILMFDDTMTRKVLTIEELKALPVHVLALLAKVQRDVLRQKHRWN